MKTARRISKTDHKARMKDRRERQLARTAGFTEYPKKPKPSMRAFVDAVKRPWVTEVHENYYRVLHPTHGWQRINNKRVFARQHMADILGRVS